MVNPLYPTEHVLRSAYDVIKGIQMPTMPEIVAKLDKEIKQPEVNLSKITKLIEEDPVISGMVLKTINSPIFSLTREIDSINQAAILMGTEKINNLVISAALKKVFSGTNPTLELIWDDSNSVAFCAGRIAKHLPMYDAEEAYATGLFHHCGALLLSTRINNYHELCIYGKANPSKIIQAEHKQFNSDHCVIGFLLAKKWHLPEIICLTILHHHNENLHNIKDTTLREHIAIIMVAKSIVDKALSGISTTDFKESLAIIDALEQLSLDSDAIIEITNDFNEFASTKGL